MHDSTVQTVPNTVHDCAQPEWEKAKYKQHLKHGSIAFQHCVIIVGLHTSDMHGQPDTSLAPFQLIPSFPRHPELTPGHLSALMCLGLFVRACIHHMAFVH
jgi:hypothetical protein